MVRSDMDYAGPRFYGAIRIYRFQRNRQMAWAERMGWFCCRFRVVGACCHLAEVKPHLTLIRIPPTTGELLTTLEAVYLPRLMRGHENLGTRLSSVESLDASRRLGRLEVSYKEIPNCITFLSEFGDLIWEAGECTRQYLYLRNMYSQSIPARKPFSRWRPNSGDDATTDALKDGEQWARSLEHHIGYVRSFFISHNVPLQHNELFTYVDNWKSNPHDYPGETLLSLMHAHTRDLIAIRNTYTAKLAALPA
jgi:hypothetical protein